MNLRRFARRETSGFGARIDPFTDPGHGFETRCGHLSAISVSAGQPVAVGRRIGATASTGRSTGTHLHDDVRVNGRPQTPRAS